MSFQQVKHFVEEDEICRVTEDGVLQFGIILKAHENGTYQVDWKSRSQQSVIENNLQPSDSKPITLIDRRHSEGGKVFHTDGRIGTIVDTHTLAWIFLPDSNQIVKDVYCDELLPLSLFTRELIELNGWIGKVSSVDWLCTVEYPDGIHCNIIVNHTHRSNTSFGYEVYNKSSPPCTNQIVQPSEKEYKSAEWHGLSWFDQEKQVFDDHVNKSAKVVGSKISKVYVKWLHRLSYADPKSSLPRVLDTEKQIEDIKQFDITFKEWIRTHSICKYKLREQDKLLDESKFDEIFIDEMDPSSGGCSSPTKKARVNVQHYAIPEAGKTVLAEVIRLRHFYNIRWSPPTSEIAPLETVLGTSLTSWVGTPLTPYGFDIRKNFKRDFVQSKVSFPLIKDNPGNIFGVTQHRYVRDELIDVIWYKIELDCPSVLGLSVSSPYELLPHRNFGNLKRGVVVTLVESKNDRMAVGMVIRINQVGLVEVFCGTDGIKKVFAPHELSIINFPKDDFVLPLIDQNVSNNLDSEKLYFAQSLANDFEELLEICPDDIKIKLGSADSWDSFSVLIIGPKHTPYEDGIFIFDVQLPKGYPNVAPKILFRSLPQGSAFLSPNITSDGEVLLPIFNNWPGTEDEGWEKEYSLLDFLKQIRDHIFVREPYLNKASLKFDKSKDRLAASDSKVLAAMTQMNASVLITVLDLMLSLYKNPPENWKVEIIQHVTSVSPKLKHKFQSWVDSPVGIYGDLNEYPKHHIFPISYGLKLALTRRIGLLNAVMKSDGAK